jgi:cytochrome c553
MLYCDEMARRRSTARAVAVPEAALAPHGASARAEELQKERARLLREIQKKQRQLELVRQQSARVSQEAVARMAPLIARQRALSAELQQLFDELLARGRLAPRARKELSKLRALLELGGFLAAADDFEPEHEPEPPPRRSKPGKGNVAPEVPGASQVGQQRRSLRDIFRSLARAVHPDQARQDGERERRTEVMKQVTRAYEEGDLARLIELENAWQSAKALDDADPEQRCRELERLNRELLDQLREVTRELKQAKSELREAASSHPPEELIELAGRELDELTAICDLIRRFRDGKIGIPDLAHAPLRRRPIRRRAR